MVGRVNTQRNIASINASVPITQDLDLTGGYSYSFNKFGDSQVQQAGNLLNSNVQTANIGLMKKLSGQDALLVTYAASKFTYQPSGTGTIDNQSLTIGARHLFTPRATLTVNVGGQVLEAQFASTTNIASVPSTLAPKGNALFIWSDATTSLTVAYDLSAAPSYVGTNTPLLSHVVSVSGAQVMFVPEVLGTMSANYAQANQYGSSSGPETNFTSYGGTAGVTYKFSAMTFLSLDYNYANSKSVFAGQPYSFDRHVVQLSLAQAIF
jgi:hypothetical protein